MSPILELHFPSNPQWLKGLRHLVNLVGQQVGFGESELAAITLAVDEACANIIKHTYQGQTDQPIILRCLVTDQQLEFQLEDAGPPIDCNCLTPRPLDELRPGGLGTHFIRAAMDEVIYDSNNCSGNLLRLIKYKQTTTR